MIILGVFKCLGKNWHRGKLVCSKSWLPHLPFIYLQVLKILNSGQKAKYRSQWALYLHIIIIIYFFTLKRECCKVANDNFWDTCGVWLQCRTCWPAKAKVFHDAFTCSCQTCDLSVNLFQYYVLSYTETGNMDSTVTEWNQHCSAFSVKSKKRQVRPLCIQIYSNLQLQRKIIVELQCNRAQTLFSFTSQWPDGSLNPGYRDFCPD